MQTEQPFDNVGTRIVAVDFKILVKLDWRIDGMGRQQRVCVCVWQKVAFTIDATQKVSADLKKEKNSK